MTNKIKTAYNHLSFLLQGNKKRLQGECNVIIFNNTYFKNTSIEITGNNNKIVFHSSFPLTSLIESRIYISGSNNVINIGENCKLKNTEIWIEDEFCELTIGEKTTIEKAQLAVTEPYSKLTLGEDCMLARNIEIRTGDSHSVIDNSSKQRINYAQNIDIGNHVWIGSRAMILKGVNIGENSIISAGAIVTTNVPKNVIMAGIPAKIIKKDITWDRKRIYKK